MKEKWVNMKLKESIKEIVLYYSYAYINKDENIH